MGFNVLTHLQTKITCFNGGGKTKENIFFNKIHEYSVSTTFLLNKHFNSYDVDNNEIINNEDEINKIIKMTIKIMIDNHKIVRTQK